MRDKTFFQCDAAQLQEKHFDQVPLDYILSRCDCFAVNSGAQKFRLVWFSFSLVLTPAIGFLCSVSLRLIRESNSLSPIDNEIPGSLVPLLAFRSIYFIAGLLLISMTGTSITELTS